MKVVTRFAPSPTGNLHLGGARTALFSYLWARHNNGTFLLRIEDTDTERSLPEYTESILAGMRWLNLHWDEPITYQSARTELYKHYLEILLQKGEAYYCTCSKEQVEKMREKALANGEKPRYDGTCREKNLPYSEDAVIRLKTPRNQEIRFHDAVKGTIVINTAELDDMVLCRSDGTPTYNFVVVVDDMTMGVTDVIRGDDHVANTPKQILLYNAFNAPIPRFAHIPMILGADRQKLSKRHGATSIIEYQEGGILPEALVNYLARLGWSHGDQEIFSMKELEQLFTIDAIHSSPAALDFDKLHWINAQYLRTMPTAYIVESILPLLNKKCTDTAVTPFACSFDTALQTKKVNDYVEQVFLLFKERIQTLHDFVEEAWYMFVGATVLQYTTPPNYSKDTWDTLTAILLLLDKQKSWKTEDIHTTLNQYMTEHQYKPKQVFPFLRYALTATKGGPDLPDILSLLGKEESLLRLKTFLEKYVVIS